MNTKAMNTIVLYEKGKKIKNYKRVFEVLNKYFTNVKNHLKLRNVYRERTFAIHLQKNQPKLS